MINTDHAKIIKAVRDAVIKTAKEAEMLKTQTVKLAKQAGQKWEASKPAQKKAKEEVMGAANTIMAFSKAVAQGVKEGIDEVKNKHKKQL